MSDQKEPDYEREYNRGEKREILKGCVLGFVIPLVLWIVISLFGLLIYVVGKWAGWSLFTGYLSELWVVIGALWAAPPITAVVSLFLTILVKRKSLAMGRAYLTVVAILTVILLGCFAVCALPHSWR